MNQKKKSLEELQQEVRALKERADIILEKNDAPKRRPVNVVGIILLITAGWGLNLYSAHHPSRWLAIVLCLAMAVGFSSFLWYGWNRKRTLTGFGYFYRDKDPAGYWFYMALFLFADGLFIYMFITLSYQFSKGLPLKL